MPFQVTPTPSHTPSGAATQALARAHGCFTPKNKHKTKQKLVFSKNSRGCAHTQVVHKVAGARPGPPAAGGWLADGDTRPRRRLPEGPRAVRRALPAVLPVHHGGARAHPRKILQPELFFFVVVAFLFFLAIVCWPRCSWRLARSQHARACKWTSWGAGFFFVCLVCVSF